MATIDLHSEGPLQSVAWAPLGNAVAVTNDAGEVYVLKKEKAKGEMRWAVVETIHVGEVE